VFPLAGDSSFFDFPPHSRQPSLPWADLITLSSIKSKYQGGTGPEFIKSPSVAGRPGPKPVRLADPARRNAVV